MRPLLAIALLVLAGLFAAARVDAAPPCSITWDGSTSTFWEVPANWDLGRVPAAGDVVCIPAGTTVVHRTGTTTVRTLLSSGAISHTGGTLSLTGTGADESTVTAYTLAGGSIAGAGELRVTGTLTWTSGSMQGAGITRIAPAARLERDTGGTVYLESGRRLENEGTIDVRADQFVSTSGSPAPLIRNTGTVVKSAGPGTATLAVAFENDGAVRSDSGVLDLRGGGGPESGGGSFGAPASAGTVALGAGTFTLADGARLLGGVRIVGTLSVAGTAGVTASGSNALAGGEIAGTGTLLVTGTLSWTGGSMRDSGITRVAPAGGLVGEPGSTLYLETGRRLENEGTVDLRSDRFISPSGSPAPLIRNTGTVIKSAGPGTATLAVAFENDGAVRSDSGVLDLRGGGGPETGGGSFGAPAAAGTVALGAGTFTLAGGARLLGGVRIDGTLAVANAAVATASGTNTLATGEIAGTGELEVTGTLRWTGGSMRDSGITRVAPAGSLVGEPGSTLYLETGRRLENEGTVDLRSDRFISPSGSPAPLIRNTGTVIKSAGPGTATLAVAFENDGAVRSDSGVLDLRGGGGPETGGGSFGAPAASGTVALGAGTFTLADGARLLGGVRIAGTLSVADAASVTASGSNALAGGEIAGTGTLLVTGTLSWTGGSMRDAGITRVAPAGTLVRELDSTVYLETGRVLENLGTIDLRSDRFISASGSPLPAIRNSGSVVKSAGPGTATIATILENDGLVRADSGVLDLRGGDGTGTSGGDIGAPAATGAVELGAGVFDLAHGARVLGNATLDGATINVTDGATATASGANTLSSGTVGGPGTLTIPGTLRWTGGTMAGTGTTRVASGGTLALAGSASLGGSRRLEVAGLFDVQGDRTLSGGFATPAPLVQLTGSGVLRKSSGAGIARLDPPLRNDGLVESTSGRLELGRGAAQPHTGRFRGASETALPAFDSAFDAPHVLGAGADLDDWTAIDGGVVGVAAGTTLAVDDRLVQRGGTLRGPGDVSVTGRILWGGGTQAGPGTTLIAPAGVVEASATGFACALTLADGRLVDNRGELRILRGTTVSTYDDPRPVIENAGRLELDGADPGTCADSHGITGNALVHNTGTIEKLGGDGRAEIQDALDNDGDILVTEGELALSSIRAVTHTGAFHGVGGPVTFADGDFDIGPGATIGGDVVVETAEVNLPEDLTLTVAAGDTLRIEGGGMLRGGELRVLGSLVWRDGRRSGAGSTLIEPGATATVGGADPDEFAYALLDTDHAFVNRGVLEMHHGTWALAGGASILNEGTLLFTHSGNLSGDGFSAGYGFDNLVHNTGEIRVTGQGVNVTAPVENDGTIEVTSGELALERLLNWSADGATDGGNLTGGSYVVRNGARLWLPGPLRTNAARLVLDGAATQLLYDRGISNPPGDAFDRFRTNAATGRLELLGGRRLTASFPVRNAGTLRIAPGSRLSAPGFTQAGASAVLRIGLTATDHGRLETPGTATLAGRLDAEHDGGFAPADGQEFPIVQAATVAGTFATVSGTALAGGRSLEARYEPPGMKLRVRPAGGTAQAHPDAAAPTAPDDPSTEGGGSGTASKPTPLAPVTLDDRALAVATGRWNRTRLGGSTVSIATRRGATLLRRDVTARGLALLARTCRRCGTVEVWFRGRLLERISLRSRRPGRRRLPIATFATARSGTVRLRTTSADRVAIDALVVRRQ